MDPLYVHLVVHLEIVTTPCTFVQQMEAMAGDSEDVEEVSGARRLVEAARGCWPHSSEVCEAGILMGSLNYP